MNELEQALQKLTVSIENLQEIHGLLWDFDRYEHDKIFPRHVEEDYEMVLKHLNLMCCRMEIAIRNKYMDQPEVVQQFFHAMDDLNRNL